MVLCGDFGRRRDLAEEITQGSFYRAFTARQSTFRGDSGDIEFTLLCAIAKNLYYDECESKAA